MTSVDLDGRLDAGFEARPPAPWAAARGLASVLDRWRGDDGMSKNIVLDQVLPAEPPSFARGDEVAVRLAFERGAPTVALTARVEQADAAAGVVECSLVWNAPESERKQLDAWLTRAS